MTECFGLELKPVKKNNTFIKHIIKSINEKSKVDMCVDVKFLTNIIYIKLSFFFKIV